MRVGEGRDARPKANFISEVKRLGDKKSGQAPIFIALGKKGKKNMMQYSRIMGEKGPCEIERAGKKASKNCRSMRRARVCGGVAYI